MPTCSSSMRLGFSPIAALTASGMTGSASPSTALEQHSSISREATGTDIPSLCRSIAIDIALCKSRDLLTHAVATLLSPFVTLSITSLRNVRIMPARMPCSSPSRATLVPPLGTTASANCSARSIVLTGSIPFMPTMCIATRARTSSTSKSGLPCH